MTVYVPSRVVAIIRDVAAEHRIAPAVILSEDRRRVICRARWEAIARARDHTPKPSYPQLGRWFRRDHTTIMHAIRRHGETET